MSIKLAVDVPGELTALELALDAAQRAEALTQRALAERTAAERGARGGDARWLSPSDRSLRLRGAADNLVYAAAELGRAMRASTAAIDEWPF